MQQFMLYHIPKCLFINFLFPIIRKPHNREKTPLVTGERQYSEQTNFTFLFIFNSFRISKKTSCNSEPANFSQPTSYSFLILRFWIMILEKIKLEIIPHIQRIEIILYMLGDNFTNPSPITALYEISKFGVV